MKKRWISLLCLAVMLLSLLTGCGGAPAEDGDGKVFRYGTTAYGPAMSNAGLNPHENYSGWSCVRYGVGETLFRFTETMELEPWLATDYAWLDDVTVRIGLRQGVTFSSGRTLDGQAVKECLEHLVAVHDRGI